MVAAPRDDLGARLDGGIARAFARLVTGVRGNWRGCAPDPRAARLFRQSHQPRRFRADLDRAAARAAAATRPVAGADYWLVGALRRFIGERVFRAVLIDRNRDTRERRPDRA